jgi:RNA-directed DNA polymerase
MLERLRNGVGKNEVWYSLHDKVFTEKTLRAAYGRVARNGGAAGVDGMTVERFGAHLEEEIARLIAAWRAETYRPQAVRRAWIPKPGSDERRPLGIPTVRDRVVQAALVMVLEPIFERTFHPRSHGFRSGCSAQGALQAVMGHLHAGRCHVVDADLKAYFDSIPHERLLRAVRRRVADRRMLALIGAFLKAGVLDGTDLSEPESGSPQGGVISPLLANIFLNDLDHAMAEAGLMMERYADDVVVLCATPEEAQQALARVQAWTAQAGLTLHPEKTRIVDLTQHGASFDFLGYRIQRHRGGDGVAKYLRLVRPKSLDRIRDTIREQTPRCMGESLAATIASLNRILRGWSAYFRSAHRTIHHELDGLVRRRLRSMLCKANGIHSWGNGSAHQRWPNAVFDGVGLFALEVAHLAHIQAHRGHSDRRAVCGKSARTVRREGRPV